MPLEIPGYYYDPDRGKYFKVEKSHTAPAAAAWSADAVKKRRIDEAAKGAAERRREELRRHVRRHALRGDVVRWGVLGREVGDAAGPFGDGDVGVAAWAEGLGKKGEVSFGRSFAGTGNLPCLWVGGGGGPRGGVAYTTLDEETLMGSYVPVDDDGRIRFDPDAPGNSVRRQTRYSETVRCPQMSSIRYHAPSHKMLLTSREPDAECTMCMFSPPLSEPEDGQGGHWMLGEANLYHRVGMRTPDVREWVVNRSTPAPASSDLICLLATNAGVNRVTSSEIMYPIASPPDGTKQGSQKMKSRKNPASSASGPREMFDVDFQHGNHNIVFAGGRSPKVWMADLRSEPQWSTPIRHPSAIARLRSVNEHQVLVCGLRSSMLLYDTRFLKTPRQAGGFDTNATSPLVVFQGHANEAHVHIGFDVCRRLGAVAAAQEDGTVALFSLESGRRIRCEALDGKGASRGRPVRALMFDEMEADGERAGLWVGEGLGIVKYSFGRGDLKNEW